MLTVRTTDCADAVVVHVTGEIDLCTAPTLSTCLATQLENSNRHPVLVINLADVSFMSCAGLRVLADTQRKATAHGTVLRLANCSPAVLRLLELPSLPHPFSLYPSLTDALRWPTLDTISPS
jgi:anti-anti-sigma factor